jgi:homoserine dehydrogenase
MFTVTPAARAAERVAPGPVRDELAVALLGLGHVGSAVAGLALNPPGVLPARIRITGALVRDVERPRPTGDAVALTRAGATLLDSAPDVLVEVLGGLEPARTLVLQALERRIPVVTANKTLLAVHGDELFEAAAATGTPLRYEAAVLAGVPFLGTFAGRPFAASLTGLTGIVNGTTNFILTEMRSGRSYADALADAQRLGYAEPDPSSDVLGLDAAQKLAVLLRHFGRCSVGPHQIATIGIDELWAEDLRQAGVLGGAIKPIVTARWTSDGLTAYAGPAFIPAAHALARIDGVQNAIVLGGAPGGELMFAGPGAGPVATASTVLDDVFEVVREHRSRQDAPAGTAQTGDSRVTWNRSAARAPLTGWFIRLAGRTLPGGADVAELLAAHGVWLRRVSDDDSRDGQVRRWLVAYPCPVSRIEGTMEALRHAAGCETLCIRTLEEASC